MKSSKKECYFAGAYTRLSQDDGDKAESDSIRNQKELIRNFQKSHSEIHIVEEYSDDGYSGVNFERPGFQKMITDIHEKKIDCIIVKDLSRFGRNYIETGKYIEQIFPALGVRFIAINDNYDSAEKRQPGDQIILPFKNLVNDAYSRDLSVKIRSNLNAKRQIGDYVGAFAPYGYKKAEDNKNQLTIDWPAAKVVRRIFQLRIEGKSNAVIADILNQEGIPCPYDYKRHSPDSKNFASGFHGNGEASWSFNAINRILTNEIYLGTMVQGKSTRPNYKIKKTVVIDQEKWIRVKNTHEAIISQRDFDIVQKLAGIDTRISTEEGEVYLFSGLVLCEKCGDTLIRRTVVRNHTRYTYYGCYDRKRTIKCKGVVIREDDLTVKQNQRLKGEFVGNIPPYGYEKSVEDGHKLVINEETAPVIRKIFQLKEQKKTNTEIAKILEEEREIAPMTYWYRKGKVHHEKYAHRTWEATTIKTILANQMYTGDMVQGKKQKCIAEGRNTQKKQKEEDYVIVPNTHEALIDRSLFDKVQKICRKELEANREKRKKYTNVSSTEDLLKNKIFSAEGLKMYRGRNVYKNERVTYNYVTSKSRKNDGSCYKFVYISEEKVFQALKKAIYFYIELLFSIEDGHMDRKRKEKAEIEQKQLQKEIANSQKNVEWYTQRLADTYKEKTEGKIQMEDYIKKQTEYRACKEAAQEKIKELSDKYEIYKMQLLGNPDYFAVYENFLKTEELNKMLIDVLVKKITVAENAKIEITFQFEDEMRMLYERLKESCSA